MRFCRRDAFSNHIPCKRGADGQPGVTFFAPQTPGRSPNPRTTPGRRMTRACRSTTSVRSQVIEKRPHEKPERVETIFANQASRPRVHSTSSEIYNIILRGLGRVGNPARARVGAPPGERASVSTNRRAGHENSPHRARVLLPCLCARPSGRCAHGVGRGIADFARLRREKRDRPRVSGPNRDSSTDNRSRDGPLT